MARACMAGVLIVVLVVCSAVATEGASQLEIHTQGTGRAVIALPALVLAGTFTGEVVQSGSIEESSGLVGFHASGMFAGAGYRDILSFEAEAWVAYRTAGTTADGRTIEIRGLLYLHRASLILLRIGDVLTGTHYAEVFCGGGAERFLGEYMGSLTEGGLTLPQPGTLMTLAGGGVFEIGGMRLDESDDSVLPIPFPTDPWLASCAEAIRQMFPAASWRSP